MSAHKKQKTSSGVTKVQVKGLPESFGKALDTFTDEFLVYSKERYNITQASIDRLDHMIKYNCTGGKFYRASVVLSTVRTLCDESDDDYNKYEHSAIVLGWCVEILQACFLVADDIMDQSTTRRGKPCWYKNPTIKYDAVNDSFILRTFMNFLINTHFKADREMLFKIKMVFDEVGMDTEMGQMLDLTSQPQGQTGKGILDGFSMDLYRKIVTFKTACYTFFLPIACGLIIMKQDGPKELDTARKICMQIGEKFQIQDDYLDNFGLPEKIGKIGTDIQDHKCSWLCVKALKLMSADQRKVFDEHYGKHEDSSVQKIKQIFDDLNLKDLYLKQEETSHVEITKLVNEASSFLPSALFLPILDKIHLREK